MGCKGVSRTDFRCNPSKDLMVYNIRNKHITWNDLNFFSSRAGEKSGSSLLDLCEWMLEDVMFKILKIILKIQRLQNLNITH